MLYYIDIAVYPKCLEPEGYQILESHTKNVSKCLLVWEVLRRFFFCIMYILSMLLTFK